MLTKYDTTKQKRIWYYTDDVTKFGDNISNKEHQIEGLSGNSDNWIQEVKINNKGDIVPNKISSNGNYKNSYIINGTGITNSTFVGNRSGNNKCSIFTCSSSNIINDSYIGFVKVTILDD